jgi:membrane-associated protease RseP (regulator of RpoE activity)
MKKILLLLSVLLSSDAMFAQEEDPLYVCRNGFEFEISSQPNWGYGKPIVISVVPNSSADAAGLRPGDIIEEVEGMITERESVDNILHEMLNPETGKIRIKTSNFGEQSELLTINKICPLSTALTERDLASVYAFYSIEDVQSCGFGCPFKTRASKDSNLLRYRTFGFSPINPDYPELEKAINAVIRRELENKGLVFTESAPDLLVQTYYSFNKNLNFRNRDNIDKFPTVSRFNMTTGNTEQLPIFYSPLMKADQAEYALNLGIRMIDPKKTKSGIVEAVWECEANEMIKSADYTLDRYAEFHLPLMLLQFPYIRSREDADFVFSRKAYNFTGISFDMDNLSMIADIEVNSPADKAGLRPGDKILKINDIRLDSDTRRADNRYKQFIMKTMELRDPNTRFTNADGFSRCMLWDKFKYAQVYDAIRNPENLAVFSYLFFFESFINLSGSNIIIFTIERAGEILGIKVKPVIVREKSFSVN